MDKERKEMVINAMAPASLKKKMTMESGFCRHIEGLS